MLYGTEVTGSNLPSSHPCVDMSKKKRKSLHSLTCLPLSLSFNFLFSTHLPLSFRFLFLSFNLFHYLLPVATKMAQGGESICAVLQLLPSEDQALLILRRLGALFVLDLGLYIVDGVEALDLEKDGLAG